MRRKILVPFVVALLALTATASATASYPWSDHAAPFDHEFGNHIDSHQQSLVKRGTLQGFFYVTIGDEIDVETGLPITTHGNCEMNPEGCTVGWVWHGVPASGTLVAHDEGAHPTWCVDPDDMPQAPGYSHFHWLGDPDHAHGFEIGDVADGWILRLIAVDSFLFDHHGGFAVTPGIDFESHANIVADC